MALRHAKEELEALLSATHGFLVHWRRDSEAPAAMLFVSRNVEAILGYTPAELIGAPDWRLLCLDPAFWEAANVHAARLRETGSATARLQFRQKNGAPLWAFIFTRRMNDETAYVSFVMDITKEHEFELQLAQVAKLAVLGEMTTGMAHELNQPLAAISILAENAVMALDKRGDDTSQLVMNKLNLITDQIERASSIIDHMRVFGRNQDIEPAHVQVGTAIDGVATILHGRLHQQAIEIVRDVAQGLPAVLGHIVLLEQVLMNLITNASDAIFAFDPPLPPPRRRVEIDALCEEGAVVIRVTDHAGGIDEAALPRVFEPFYTTKAVGVGTGLGLSISFGIITDMGGTIAARNVGDGAEFVIRLPAMVTSP